MKLTRFYCCVTCSFRLKTKLLFFPIISAYVEQVSRFLARKSRAKMEGKLLKGGSEIDGRFGNFSNNQTLVLRGEEIERILSFYEKRSLRPL